MIVVLRLRQWEDMELVPPVYSLSTRAIPSAGFLEVYESREAARSVDPSLTEADMMDITVGPARVRGEE